MDTLLTPGLQSYAVTPGHRYRVSGLVRGSLTDDQAASALLDLGFTQLTFSGKGQPPPPGSGWPTETLPPPSSNEYVFRAEGTWSGAGNEIPTGINLAGGAIVFYQMWDHMPDVQQASLTTPAPAAAAPASSRTLFLVGAALAAGAAGLFAGLSIWGRSARAASGAHEGTSDTPDGYYVSRLPSRKLAAWPVKVIRRYSDGSGWLYVEGLAGKFRGRQFTIVPTDFATYVPTGARLMRDAGRENPIEYHSSSTYQGVRLHTHIHDGRFCVDYRAIDRVAPGKGGVVCAKSKDDAERQAQKAIDSALRRPPPLPSARRAPGYPTPWD